MRVKQEISLKAHFGSFPVYATHTEAFRVLLFQWEERLFIWIIKAP
jgi:hypothetical protein